MVQLKDIFITAVLGKEILIAKADMLEKKN